MKNLTKSRIFRKFLVLNFLCFGLWFAVLSDSSIQSVQAHKNQKVKFKDCPSDCAGYKDGCNLTADNVHDLCKEQAHADFLWCYGDQIDALDSCLMFDPGPNSRCWGEFDSAMQTCNYWELAANTDCDNNYTSDKNWCSTEYSFCLGNC